MKFIKIIKISTLIILSLQFSLKAQINNEQDVFEDLPERFIFQVKQLDQFIKRFNSSENTQGIRINSAQVSREDREKTLAAVFNLDLLENNSFREKATAFIRDVSGSKIGNLSFYDKDYFATIDCQVLYNNKRHRLTLTMVLEGDSENGAKWVIKGAQADFLQVKTKGNTASNDDIIPPTNHEVEFVGLLEVFNGKKDISNYISATHQPNQLDRLYYIIKDEGIKMLSTSSPTYHFLQIPGWVFTVNFFNRNSNNSGWLISHLEKIDKSGLNKYKSEKLSILQ